MTTEWTYHKEWSFASNCLIFSVLETFEKNKFDVQTIQIRIFRKRWSLILGCFFTVSIVKSSI